MTSFVVRLDEADKTDSQIRQREDTYAAADILIDAGIPCEVREFFTGSSKTADSAAIFLKGYNIG